MLHNVILCYRSATAPLPTGAATLTGTYPADIASTESLFYDAGASTRFPFAVRAFKGAGGQDVVVKFQGAALSVDGATFASRTPGGGQGLLQVWGLTGPLYTVQMQQQTGTNTPISHALTGSVGLNLALTILLPTKENGQPAGTIKAVADYIAATVALNVHFAAVASGATDAILGATLDRRMAGRVQWGDIESDRAGTVAIEHTFSATAGSFLDGTLVPACKNLIAVRVLAKSAGVPAAGDGVQVIATTDGL